MAIIFQINRDGTGVNVRGPRDEIICVLHSISELDKLPASFDWDDVYVSSSIDFPEDSTNDADVIALCKYLRP